MILSTVRFPIGSFWALWHLLIRVRFNNALHWLFVTSIEKAAASAADRSRTRLRFADAGSRQPVEQFSGVCDQGYRAGPRPHVEAVRGDPVRGRSEGRGPRRRQRQRSAPERDQPHLGPV